MTSTARPDRGPDLLATIVAATRQAVLDRLVRVSAGEAGQA